MNHQRVKRIKGLLGYSEVFKDNNREFRYPKYTIKTLKSRSYRKARELLLELHKVNSQKNFLEKFLKVQRNLRNIRIRFTSYEMLDITKPICEIFSKMSRINRIQIDFRSGYVSYLTQSDLQAVRATRKLPDLKELSITAGNKEISPVSAPLLAVGFYFREEVIYVEDYLNIEEEIKKNRKFSKIDTIRVHCNSEHDNFDEFLEAIDFFISKLPNLREFSIEFPTGERCTPTEMTLKIFDSLFKASTFEILKLEIDYLTFHMESIIIHPIFKVKSLKKVHLLVLSSSMDENSIKIVHLLRDIPMLYELSLSLHERHGEMTKEIMEEIMKMTNLRKLHLFFVYSYLSEKEASEILHSLYRMPLLEELELHLHTERKKSDNQNTTPPSLRDEIRDLPRLQKLTLVKREKSYSSDKLITEMAEFFGKCSRLKEMTFDVEKCGITSWENLSQRLLISWGKLRQLQDIKLNMKNSPYYDNKSKERDDMITVPMLVEWMKVFDGMESLQKFQIINNTVSKNDDESKIYDNLSTQRFNNPKYRFFDFKKW